jgi:hypothetical protein
MKWHHPSQGHYQEDTEKVLQIPTSRAACELTTLVFKQSAIASLYLNETLNVVYGFMIQRRNLRSYIFYSKTEFNFSTSLFGKTEYLLVCFKEIDN